MNDDGGGLGMVVGGMWGSEVENIMRKGVSLVGVWVMVCWCKDRRFVSVGGGE